MNDLLIRLSENPGLDESQRAEIEASFGPRGRKALAALDAGKVKKYHDFFVVEGRTAEYVVDEDFCTCNDFLYRGRTCWHLIAVQIAVATGKFTRVDGWYTDQLK
jgi:predicted nucleic acid-binding Zn finger protein